VNSRRDCIDRWSLDLTELACGTLPVQARFRFAHHASKCLNCRLQLLILLDIAERSGGPGAQDVKAAAVIAGVDTQRMGDWLVAMYACDDVALVQDDDPHEATPRALLAAFRQYMMEAQAQCEVLVDVIRIYDPGGVEHVASKAVRNWLGGRSRLRCLMLSETTTPRESDRRLLEGICTRIVNLLAIAVARAPASYTKQKLRQLRVQLSNANREPLAQM
jgi:hypothetical protein